MLRAGIQGFGHELLTTIVRYAPILVSTLDPDSPTSTRSARLVYRLRLSNPCIPSNGKGHKRMHVYGLPIAMIKGFQPQLKASKSYVLPLDDIPMCSLNRYSLTGGQFTDLLEQASTGMEVYLHPLCERRSRKSFASL